jgi:hypothetical protein
MRTLPFAIYSWFRAVICNRRFVKAKHRIFRIYSRLLSLALVCVLHQGEHSAACLYSQKFSNASIRFNPPLAGRSGGPPRLERVISTTGPAAPVDTCAAGK